METPKRDFVIVTDADGVRVRLALPLRLDRAGRFYYIKIKKKIGKPESIYMNMQEPVKDLKK